MKLTFLFFTITLMSFTATATAQKVSISAENEKVGNVLESITKQTGLSVAYSRQIVNTNRRVSFELTDAELNLVLDRLISGTNLSYEVKNGKIYLFEKGTSGEGLQQQRKKVSGVISDNTGEPIIGANIMEKGTINGTITGIDGDFSLDVAENATLVISYIGYISQNITVAGKNIINITLSEDAQSLDEVVVVGYGVQRKRDLTGAVSSVKMDDAPVGTFSTAAHALAGKAAGLRVTQNTAQPGAGATFRIRGETSIKASNDPLIIVDGFPISKSAGVVDANRYKAGSQDNVMEMINPNDIESIEVLKDASATAIYGSRAGHGVIIITTKRGKAGKPSVSYSGNASVQTMSTKYDLMNAPEYMQLSNAWALEKWRRDTGAGVYAGYVTPKPNTAPYSSIYTDEEIAKAKTTNWMDEITQTGFQQSHNVSVSGGSEKSKYLASLNYFDQKGIIKNNGMKRITANLNSDYEFSKYVKGGLSFNISRNSYDNVPLGTGENEYSGVIASATFFEPNIPVRDENGNFSESNVYKQRPNPVSLLDIKDKTTKDRVLGTAFLSVEPTKGLIVKANLGFDRKAAKFQSYLPTTTLHGATSNGFAYQRQEDGMDYLFNLTANYMKSIGKHNITALVGYEWQQFTTEWLSASNTNFPINQFTYNNLGAGSGDKSVGSNATKDELASIFGRINYSYADKYLFTATLRADAASNFDPDHRWGYFPSVSVGWRFSEENFMKSIQNIISNGKLRGGYGQTGNSSVGNRTQYYYKAEEKWVFGNTGTTGMMVKSLGNPNITWETTSEWNIGLDLGFLNNRINFTAEYYDRVVSDLLVDDKRLPVYNEIAEIAANVGSTQSQGIELTLNTVNINRNNLVWTTDLTFYKYKDRWKERDPNWIPEAYESVNDPIRAIFDYRSDGLLKVGEEVPAWQKGLLPGQIKIKNLSDEGVADNLDPHDKVLIGTKDPNFSFGFNNTVRYKQFDFNMYFYGEVGRWRDASYYDTWIPYMYQANDGLYNGSVNALDSWTMDNQNTNTPSLLTSNSPRGDFFMKKVSFLRCRNITVGYTIPGIKNVLNSMRINLSVNNPFVISNWNGIDPETDYNPSDRNVENAGSYSYPNARTFSIGVDINF
ncbi:MAG: TonB-dependent receptor [Tannerella sp.]|nr:TonB-dependent receptor [Tannerella sp.]